MSISKGDPYHHGSLRSALIEAAVATLQQDGVEALSLRKLAKEIGVSHNAPYMHFADREALFAAVAEEGFNLLVDAIEDALKRSSEDWFDRFQSGCVAYVTFMVEHPAHARVMFRYYDSKTHTDLSKRAATAFRLLENLIQEGQASGCITPGDSRHWTTLIWSLLHGISTISGTSKQPLPPMGETTPGELTRKHLDLLYMGLKPRSAEQK